MNIGYYSDDEMYGGVNPTFNDFYDRYKTTGDPKIQDMIVMSHNGKKLVLSTIDRSTTSPAQDKTRVYIFYPFKTNQ